MLCVYRDHGKVYCNAEKSLSRSDKCGQSHCEVWSKFKHVLELSKAEEALIAYNREFETIRNPSKDDQFELNRLMADFAGRQYLKFIRLVKQ